MEIRTKVEIAGRYLAENPVSFCLNGVTVTFSTLGDKNYVEATHRVTGFQDVLNGEFEKLLEYEHEQEKVLLRELKSIESIGSFLISIQEVKYDERETDWIAESEEENAVVDRLSKSKWSIEKNSSKLEISGDKISQLITLCSTITDELFAFEYLRQGNVSFSRGNYYFAFINYYMLLEEAFGKGVFRKNQLERNFVSSEVFNLCILTAIDMLYRNPLDSLYVEWIQNEIKKRQKNWDISGIVYFLIAFRGDYLHSHKRTKILEQRDQFFKYMAAFTQAVCWAYCCYIIRSENKTDSEKTEYVVDEIKRLNACWRL